MCYILQSDWSLSLLLNIQDSLQQGAYRKHHLQFPETESTSSGQGPVSVWKITPRAHLLLLETRVKWRIYTVLPQHKKRYKLQDVNKLYSLSPDMHNISGSHACV